MLHKVLIKSLQRRLLLHHGSFVLLPLTIVNETQDPPVVVIECELPESSGLPVPEEAKVTDTKNADLDLETFLEGTMSCNKKKANSYAIKTFNSVMDSLRSKEGHSSSLVVTFIRTHIRSITTIPSSNSVLISRMQSCLSILILVIITERLLNY